MFERGLIKIWKWKKKKIVEEQLGNILDNLQTNINSLPECYRIIIHYKDKENVKQQLEELEGIKSLNFGLYILPTETIRWIIVSVL